MDGREQRDEKEGMNQVAQQVSVQAVCYSVFARSVREVVFDVGEVVSTGEGSEGAERREG